MDNLIENPALLPRIYDFIFLVCIAVQCFFLLVVIIHTPKEMSTYRYVILNSSTWSFLILIFVGFLVRPIALFPAPFYLVNGPAKHWNTFFGGNFQFVVTLILFISKTTAYTMCLTSNFIAYRFPFFARKMTFCGGFMIFLVLHSIVIGGMLFAAFESGLMVQSSSSNTAAIQNEVNFLLQYTSFQTLLNQSLVLEIPSNQSFRSFFTTVYLVVTFVQIIFNLVLLVYTVVQITQSIRLSNLRHSNYRIRLRRLLIIRVLSPMVTFNIPCFIGVLLLHSEGMKYASKLQLILFLALISPCFCSIITIFGLRSYRRALLALIKLKPAVILHHQSETDEESTIARRTLSKRNTISFSYSLPAFVTPFSK
ncbi:hypothetical protein M3Y95_00991700 [Aphelenchoides besseyi]|nr:hypothetical protein M3Y95_00991700 [Aphelenchoides besseyi]